MPLFGTFFSSLEKMESYLKTLLLHSAWITSSTKWRRPSSIMFCSPSILIELFLKMGEFGFSKTSSTSTSDFTCYATLIFSNSFGNSLNVADTCLISTPSGYSCYKNLFLGEFLPELLLYSPTWGCCLIFYISLNMTRMISITFESWCKSLALIDLSMISAKFYYGLSWDFYFMNCSIISFPIMFIWFGYWFLLWRRFRISLISWRILALMAWFKPCSDWEVPFWTSFESGFTSLFSLYLESALSSN